MAGKTRQSTNYLAECLNSILPSAVEYGIATADDFDTESLPRRLSLSAPGHRLRHDGPPNSRRLVSQALTLNGPTAPPRT